MIRTVHTDVHPLSDVGTSANPQTMCRQPHATPVAHKSATSALSGTPCETLLALALEHRAKEMDKAKGVGVVVFNTVWVLIWLDI